MICAVKWADIVFETLHKTLSTALECKKYDVDRDRWVNTAGSRIPLSQHLLH